jgi:23S rRNA U2552 (ribose-2'-O)-methylase RlmE/FtsJ
MSVQLPDFPTNACTYEIYDPVTLKPTNDSTYVRLMELGWAEADFLGKTVLDIGANSGALSIHAHRLGATSIHAVDVQVPLVEFISAVAKLHKLPIKVERRALFDLNAREHAADVVCFMEVLHWIVDQGGSVARAIEHVASLTRDTLYIETPWDIHEPSIARAGKISADQYNMELIMRELSRHFHDVQFVRFMTYFGTMPNSKRVLLKASKPRTLSLAVTSAGEANLVDIFLKPSSRDVALVTTVRGPAVLKRLPAESNMGRYQPEVVDALCRFLTGLRDPAIVPPLRIGQDFRYDAADGHRYMMFPFVGDLGTYFVSRAAPAPVADPIAAAVALRQDLRQAPAALVSQLRDGTAAIPVVNFDGLQGTLPDRIRTGSAGALCRAALGRMAGYDRRREDALTHNDVQGGNMVTGPNGKARVVDIDWMRTGTPYSDLLSCAIYCGSALSPLLAGLATLKLAESRPLEQFDIDFSVAQALKWVEVVTTKSLPIPEQQVETILRGLATLAQLSEAHLS